MHAAFTALSQAVSHLLEIFAKELQLKSCFHVQTQSTLWDFDHFSWRHCTGENFITFFFLNSFTRILYSNTWIQDVYGSVRVTMYVSHLQSKGCVQRPKFFCANTEQTARGPWRTIRWIWQKVDGIRITDCTFLTHTLWPMVENWRLVPP